ncbi:DUF2244 domain-containing protein [Marinicauda algicola]|uniref:DUF2244 domain-containing protein n=1 Tax=Marinicauda algicola TaxID=2029849 RepID=A0A4S2H119_9PROT|nr:DUF2244 domain-containing protein [Marinicauda algicola]TGY88998.1 DUF2244 domain-containing protein [Marinicauda algicola]
MERRVTYETWPAEEIGTGLGAPPGAPGELLFDAHIRPHRSLPNPGFYALMIALAVLSFIAGIAFVLAGAWPVVGFFGLEVLLVWLCFKLSYRDGRRLEIVRVTAQDIHVARRGPTGQETRFRLPAAWTRVEIEGAGEPDVQARLTSQGKSLIIGAMLSPAERESLAAAVREALDKARRARGPLAQESGGAPA